MISTIKCMKMLGNSFRGINSLQEKRLYRCCIWPITLYSFLLWYYDKAPLNFSLSILWKMQQRAALWISSAFHASSTAGIKTISGLIPIHFYLRKLYGRFLLRESSLSPNHIISSILSFNGSYDHNPYNISIDNLTSK